MGIAVIYQELAMVPELPVVQNIFIGKELTGRLLLDLKQMTARAGELLAHFGLKGVHGGPAADGGDREGH